MNPISQSQRKLLKVAVKQLGIAEPVYRDLLRRYGGCNSSKDMDKDGFGRVMAQLEARGFRPQIKDGEGKAIRATDGRRKVLRKTGECLRALKMPWRYADEMARRMWRVEKLEWCTPQQIYQTNAELIAQVERSKARRGAVEANHAR